MSILENFDFIGFVLLNLAGGIGWAAPRQLTDLENTYGPQTPDLVTNVSILIGSILSYVSLGTFFFFFQWWLVLVYFVLTGLVAVLVNLGIPGQFGARFGGYIALALYASFWLFQI